MGIIGDKEHKEREAFLDAKDRRENPTKYARLELIEKKDLIVGEIVASAKKNFIERGEIRAYGDLRFGASSHLVGDEESQRLIAEWLHEVDPSLRATVTIGPDCSGNFSYAAEVVVEFTSAT